MLIQKENVDIGDEKGAQISVVAKKIVTRMIRNYDYKVQASYALYLFFIFSLLCLYYVTDLM